MKSRNELLVLGIEAEIASLQSQVSEFLALRDGLLADEGPPAPKAKNRAKIAKDSDPKTRLHWTQRPENRKRVLAMVKKRAKMRQKG